MRLESITKGIREDIGKLSQVLRLLEGGAKTSGRKVSPAGKARMAAAQKARWAKVKGKTKKRKLSRAGRAAIGAAQKARWAKLRAAKKK